MQRRLLILTLALTVLLMGAAPALAQDGGWFAYLYNSITGTLLRVNADGSQQTFSLNLNQNTFVGGYDMAFNATGSRVGYCALDIQPGAMTGTAVLHIRDIAAGVDLQAVNLGAAIGCRTTRAAFSSDETQIAVGVVKYYPGDPQADTSVPPWSLYVVDVASGALVAEMNPATTAAVAVGILPDLAAIPEVRRFANGEIIFAEIPWGIGGGPEYQAYVWQPVAGTLSPEPTGIWGKATLRWLAATDELVWLDVDPSLMTAEQGGPLPPYNIVMSARSGQTQGMLFHSADMTPVDLAFINDGAQLAVLLMEPYNMADPASQSTQWIALDRAGGQMALQTIPQYSTIVNAPGGYALFELSYSADFSTPRSALTLYSGGAARELWASAEQGWELAWGVSPAANPGLPPFPVTAQ